MDRYQVSILLVIWAATVLTMSSLSASGVIKTVSINGMRRRKAGESDAAWRAGLRAYFPWALGTVFSLLLFAALISIAPPEFMIPLVVAAFVSMVVQGWPLGIWAFNRAASDVGDAIRTDRAERGDR